MKNQRGISLHATVKSLSQLDRWSDEEQLNPDWDERTLKLAKLISPMSRVLEFGAGRRFLESALPEGCTYTPSDIVSRGEDTIVCDLNSETLPNFFGYHVAVFGGVLEYIHNVPRLIAYLSAQVGEIVASYAHLENNRRNRKSNGWVNSYGLREFLKIFESNGYECKYLGSWRNQVVCKFDKCVTL